MSKDILYERIDLKIANREHRPRCRQPMHLSYLLLLLLLLLVITNASISISHSIGIQLFNISISVHKYFNIFICSSFLYFFVIILIRRGIFIFFFFLLFYYSFSCINGFDMNWNLYYYISQAKYFHLEWKHES